MYFNVKDHYRMKFYQLPKVFFTNPKYKKMSNDAKIAWSILSDRMQLSISNEWYDQEGNIFFLYGREKLAEILELSLPTITKITKELQNADLLEKKRLGLGKTDRLYLKQPIVESQDIYEIQKKEEEPPSPAKEKPETLAPVKKLKILTSRNQNFLLPEVKNFTPNDTELKETDFSETEFKESIYLSFIEELNDLDVPTKVKHVIKKHQDRITRDAISLIDIDLAYHSNINDLNDHDFCVVLNNSLGKTKGKIQDMINLLTRAVEKYYIDVIHPREAATEEKPQTFDVTKRPGGNWLEGYPEEEAPLRT